MILLNLYTHKIKQSKNRTQIVHYYQKFPCTTCSNRNVFKFKSNESVFFIKNHVTSTQHLKLKQLDNETFNVLTGAVSLLGRRSATASFNATSVDDWSLLTDLVAGNLDVGDDRWPLSWALPDSSRPDVWPPVLAVLDDVDGLVDLIMPSLPEFSACFIWACSSNILCQEINLTLFLTQFTWNSFNFSFG